MQNENITYPLALVTLTALMLLIGIDARSEQSYTNTTVETKGQPLRGEISSPTGPIGKIEFFGEGTTTLRFDAEQNLILRDSAGKAVAGFEATAIDPKSKKITQLWEYWLDHGNKKCGMLLEHKVSMSAFRGGKVLIEGAEAETQTSYKVNGRFGQLTFKRVQQADRKGKLVNSVVFASKEGKEFVFEIAEPRSNLHHILVNNSAGDEFVRYLKKILPSMDELKCQSRTR